MRPNVIFVDQPTDQSSRDEDDRKLIEDFYRSTAESSNSPLSPTDPQPSAPALARVSSIFHTSARSTIRERASIVNMFNQLQFEMPPLPVDPIPPDEPSHVEELASESSSPAAPKPKKTRSQKRLARRKLRKLQRMAARGMSATSLAPAGSSETRTLDTEQVLASTEPSFFRQYMVRAKPKPAGESTLRPLTATQCHAYLQSVALEPTTIGSRGIESVSSSPAVSPDNQPMQFLFFGGCSEENRNRLQEIDAAQRRYRARFVASQPISSATEAIHIRPTLVRGLPPVFEPRFETMYIY